LPTFVPFVTDFPKPKAKAKKPAYLVDPVVSNPRNTSPYALPGFAAGAGPLQDPGVPGMTIGRKPVNPVTGTYQGHQLWDLPNAGAPGVEWPEEVPFGKWGEVPGVTPAGTDGTKPKPPRGYWATLFDDPAWQLAMNQFGERSQGARNLLRQQIRNAVIGYGRVPNFAGNTELQGYADDLDQETALAAQQNPFSTTAQIERQNQVAGNEMLYRLAGGGRLGYGTQNVAEAQRENAYRQAGAQALGNLQQALYGNIADYANTYRGLEDVLTGSYTDIATRLAQTPGAVYPLATAEAPAGYGAIAAPESLGSAAGEEGAVTWGGRQFTSKQALTDYLNQFSKYGGITPAAFAATHPAAWGRLT